MSRIQNAREQLTETIGRLDTRQKIGLGLATLITVGVLAWIIVAATEVPQRTLMTDLSPEQMASITEQLDAQAIPYEIQGESGIAVPQDRLHEARMHLAGQGMLEMDGAGFELFDEADFGMTSFTQKVNYQRAMESELARTIRSIDTIKQARVHLVMPEDALFREDQKETSASVVVTTASGMSPTPGQIQSIRQLVASAVEGLAPNHVTILDSNGNMLAEASSDSLAFNQNGVVRVSDSMERELERQVGELLDTIVGPGHSRARVAIELETAEVVETVEAFDPERVAVRSEQRTEQVLMRGEDGNMGPVGAASNLPGGPAAEARGGTPRQDTRNSETVNYDVTRTVRQTTQAAMGVKRISVAVVIDEGALVADGDESSTADPALVAARLERLTGLVQNAVGFDRDRGDSVLVTSEAFASVAQPEETEESLFTSPEFLMPATRYGVLLILAVLILVFVARPLVKTLLANPAAADPVHDAELEGGEAAIALGTEGGAVAAIEDLTPESRLREEILALGRSDIDRTSKVISQWIRVGAEPADAESSQHLAA